jgi:TRAP-type C4-dicarboxylate transport system permease small subunit
MKVIKWLDKNFEKYVLLFLLVLITCVMSYLIFMRFVLNNPPFWADRVAQYSLVISTFFSISYCIRRGSSLKIDVLVNALPKVLLKAVVVVVKVILIAFFLLFTYASIGVVQSFNQLGTIDTALGIPMSVFYSFVVFGFVLATIRSVQVLVFEFFPEKDPEDTTVKIAALSDSEKNKEGN